jgi:hypothetical protein
MEVQTLRDRPTLPRHLHIVARAYSDLGGVISFESVAAYATLGGAPSRAWWLLDRLRAFEAANEVPTSG